MTKQSAELKKWLANRKKAARKIDPKTAAVLCTWGPVLDPYQRKPELPEENDCVGRVHFARSPGSDIWVSFEELSPATRDALWKHDKAHWRFLL
jgi:hypothetical protein